MEKSLSKITLWIQNIPETFETVLSLNGQRLQSGTSKYIKEFAKLTSIDLERYTILTPTLKRLTQDKSRIRKIKDRVTLISGHFVETDKSDRKICYRALIIDAENKEEECSLLTNEAQLYGCTISETDKAAFKKKSYNKLLAISFTAIIILILILFQIWKIRF